MATARVSMLLIVACAFGLATTGGDANASAPLRWEQRAPMPTPRHEAAYAKSGGRFYVMGGLLEGLNTVPLVDIYDPATDSWSSGPPLPYAPNHAMGAARGGTVYHLGGYQVALEAPSDRALALQDGEWVDLPAMPAPRAAGAAEFLGGKLYVVGGVGPEGVVDDVFVFDPDAQEWSTLPGPDIAREHLTLVRYKGKLYAIGGRALTFESIMRSIERFDPTTKRWRTVAQLPYATSGHAAAVTRNGFLVVLGGEGPPGPFAEAVAYDLRRKEWHVLPSLDPARTGFGAAAFGARVFSFHGAGNDPGYYDMTESIDLSGLRD